MAGPRPCLACAALSARAVVRASRPRCRRDVSTVQEFRSPRGSYKVDVSSSKLIGVASSRGERPYQEDTFIVRSIDVGARELRRNLRDAEHRGLPGSWRKPPDALEEATQQVLLAGVFDGHAGDQVSTYLRDRLPALIEEVKPSEAAPTVKSFKSIGGYMRRYEPAILKRLLGDSLEPDEYFALDERVTLAFLAADAHVLGDSSIDKAGSVATVALIHSLDDELAPFYAAKSLSITIAHVGDTRGLLCAARTGRVIALTENHHPDSRVEGERLRRTGAGLITDSFGESRWAGALANTRGLGDRGFKRLGVVAEPDITKRVVEGQDYAFIVLMSDGVSGSMSDQEVVDLCRGHTDPTLAARAIVDFAEEVGETGDNLTAIVIPLAGWRRLGGSDSTASRREFRRRNVDARSRRQ